MNCNIEFNGVDGFEGMAVKRHTMLTSCWVAIYFKKCEPLDYIDNRYSKATYLRTYANVLQPRHKHGDVARIY
ncbi:hypothetical protein H5410_017293 [Solanum commersonii]|uniref:Uncharacterized protein n=1 Tax=Solanum commersonii TaxID=4109 RepID=A0A9J5ZYR3_SOLCO|nr:hypothetical protein H5410_017293 [Solanum commersonii]